MTVQVIHKNSSVQNRPILETQLANGELGINYHESGPFVQLKDTDGEVIRVGGVVQQETQPGLGQKGAFWFKPSTKILYLHNGTTWIAIGGAAGGGGGDVTNTSQLVNDGQNGVDPYITAQDVALPGDGELTIRQGGVSKGIFKANQTGDAIIDLDGGGVTKLVAGTNVNLSPATGIGEVTINATGGGGGGATNLGYTAAPAQGTVTSDTGTDAVIPVVDASNAGLMTPSQKDKLDDAAETGDIGDATLTITQGGVSKGTFTANASTNVTIDVDAGSGTPPGDGTISIETFDGVPVGSFSVNQTDDETIVLPPSGGGGLQIGDPVSLLTNDAGYITDADVGGGQISIFTTDGPVASFNVNQSADQDITIPTGGGTPQVQSDYTQADTAAVDFIKNKPDLSLKADLVGGVVPTSQLPAIAISQFLGTVGSEAAMLALTGQTGDYCIRTDLSTTWIISGPDGSSIDNWTQIVTPTSPVESVNGQTGVVVLSPADIGAATAAQGSTADSALQPGDDVSELTNDAGYLTSADVPIVYWQQAAGVLSPVTATDVINVAGYRIDQLTAITASSPG